MFTKAFLFCSEMSSLSNPSDGAPLSSSSLNVTQWLKSFEPGSFKFSGVCAEEVVDAACRERWQEESRSKRPVFFARELLSGSCACWPGRGRGPRRLAICSVFGASCFVVVISGLAANVGARRADCEGAAWRTAES